MAVDEHTGLGGRASRCEPNDHILNVLVDVDSAAQMEAARLSLHFVLDAVTGMSGGNQDVQFVGQIAQRVHLIGDVARSPRTQLGQGIGDANRVSGAELSWKEAL